MGGRGEAMKLSSLRQWLLKLEPWVVGFYLLYFMGLDVAPPVVSLMNVASYGLLALLIAGCWRQVLYGLTKDIPLILLNLMVMVSVLWSASPEVTSMESRTLLRGSIFGVYLAVRFGIGGSMRVLYWALAVGCVVSFMAGVAMPSYGIHTSGDVIGAWKGVFVFKNLFASVITMAAILFLIVGLSDRKRRWLTWGFFALSILLLILSKGKTALACFLISLYLLPLYGFIQKRFKLRVLLITSALFFTFCLAVLALSNIELIVIDLLGKNLEFNGRLPIWTLMLEKVSERPWFGYGYAAFWTSDASYYLLTHSWALDAFQAGVRFNAHNGYIDLLLQLGLVGTALYFFGLFTMLGRMFFLLVQTKSVEIFWAIQTTIFLFLINLSDSLSIVSGGGQWSLYVAFSIASIIQCERIQRNHHLKSDSGEIQIFN
jgi:exopolysaccharide production protein ExoQ